MSGHVKTIIVELPYDERKEITESAILGPRGAQGEKGEQGTAGEAPVLLDGGNF